MIIYVINLDRSPERLEHMKMRLKELEIPFDRIPAIDGRNLSEDKINEYLADTEDHINPLGPSQVACFLSHREAWRLLCESDADYALILEDDVVISSSITEVVQTSSWIPDEAGIIKLELNRWGKIILGSKAHKANGGREVRALRSDHWGTAGYIIKKNLAAQILKESRQFSVPVDCFLFAEKKAQRYNVFQLSPAPIKQLAFGLDGDADKFESTVESPGYHHQKRSILNTIFYKTGRELRLGLRKFSGKFTLVTGLGKTVYIRLFFG